MYIYKIIYPFDSVKRESIFHSTWR